MINEKRFIEWWYEKDYAVDEIKENGVFPRLIEDIIDKYKNEVSYE